MPQRPDMETAIISGFIFFEAVIVEPPVAHDPRAENYRSRHLIGPRVVWAISIPRGSAILITVLSLPRCRLPEKPPRRVPRSSVSRRSILMTSAPWSARMRTATGPANHPSEIKNPKRLRACAGLFRWDVIAANLPHLRNILFGLSGALCRRKKSEKRRP